MYYYLTATKDPEEEELQDEINKLENKLKEKHNKLFQIQRNKYRKKASSIGNKEETFVRPRVC